MIPHHMYESIILFLKLIVGCSIQLIIGHLSNAEKVKLYQPQLFLKRRTNFQKWISPREGVLSRPPPCKDAEMCLWNATNIISNNSKVCKGFAIPCHAINLRYFQKKKKLQNRVSKGVRLAKPKTELQLQPGIGSSIAIFGFAIFFSTGNFFAPSSNCRNFKWLLLYCTPSFFKTTLCSMNRVHCPLSPANFDKRLCSCFVYYNDYHIVVYTSKERSGANKKIAKTHVELWLMTWPGKIKT